MNGILSGEIEKAYENEKVDDYRSSRIGASIAGDPCTAYLAFNLRGFPQSAPSARLKRIFRDGHRIESTVVKDLVKAGYIVHEKDPMTGKQYGWTAYGGNAVYYADGILESPTIGIRLLEVKSMNDALFTRFKTRGVKVSHRKYYDQMQIGMGLSNHQSCVLIAYNKDNSEYWDEVIEFNVIEFNALMYHVEKSIYGKEEKIAETKSDWRCKECWRKDVCWNNADVVKDVRTCANAYMCKSTNEWKCSVDGCSCSTCASWKRYEPPKKGDGKP